MDSDNFVTARIGQRIGSRWKLSRVLGQGGMAAVYEGEDESGSKAAVKVLHPEMAASKEIRERFLREGYAANQVDHPGAVRVLAGGNAPLAPAPERVPGGGWAFGMDALSAAFVLVTISSIVEPPTLIPIRMGADATARPPAEAWGTG